MIGGPSGGSRSVCFAGPLLLAMAIAVPLLLGACGTDDGSEIEPRVTGGTTAGEGDESPDADQQAGIVALVALEDADAIAVLAGPRWRLVRRLAAPPGPHNVAASADGRQVAVSSPPADRVTIVGAPFAEPAVVGVAGAPHDISFGPGAGRLWVAAEGAGRLVRVSVARRRAVTEKATGGPPHDLELDPAGKELWVTIDGSPIAEIRSPARGDLLGRARLGGAPHDLAFEPESGRVWLSNFLSPSLTVASPSTRRAEGSLTTGGEPHHFAFGLGCLWVSDNEGDRVLRIDPASRRIVGETRVGGAPHHVAVAGGRVLVAVNDTGRVAVLSARGRLVEQIEVGAGPHGIAVASGRRARSAQACE